MNNGVYKNRQLMAGGGMGGMDISSYAQLTAGGAQNIIGLYEWYQGEQMKKRLRGVPNPRYKEANEMASSRLRAEQMAKGGYTPAETSAFFQNLAKLSNQNYNKATQTGGGGLASTVNAGIGYNKLGALNTYASQDASLHRQNVQYADSFYKNLQLLKNMNTTNLYAEHRNDVNAANAMVAGGVSTFANGFATAGGSGADMSGMQKGIGQQDAPVQQQAAVNYDPNNSGYNQGYDRNAWMYGYANQGQPAQTEMDPYQAPVAQNSNNYTW